MYKYEVRLSEGISSYGLESEAGIVVKGLVFKCGQYQINDALSLQEGSTRKDLEYAVLRWLNEEFNNGVNSVYGKKILLDHVFFQIDRLLLD